MKKKTKAVNNQIMNSASSEEDIKNNIFGKLN